MTSLGARLVRAVAVASALACVLAARAFDDYDGVRLKVVQEPVAAADGRLALPIAASDTTVRLAVPFALIARIRNDAAAAQSFVIAINGTEVCSMPVASRALTRVDCVVNATWLPARTQELTITSLPTTWSLQYLELASHHGATSGADQVFILPKESASFTPATKAEVIGVWLLVTAMLLLPWPARMPRPLEVAYAVVVGLIALLVLALIVAPWVSRYDLRVSWRTVVRWGVIFALPALCTAGLGVGRWLIRVQSPWASATRLAAVVGAVVLPFVLIMRHRLETYQGNYSGFVSIGRTFVEHSPLIARTPDALASLVLVDGGYDGQFMYYMAWDPLLRGYRAQPEAFQGLIDTPPYRYGRIGYAWLTWLTSLGDWRQFPRAMVWLDLVGIGCMTLAFALAARAASLNAAWCAVALLIPGLWQSMETALPEPIAAAGLALAYLAWWRGHWIAAALLMGVTLLVRESPIVFVAILVAATFLRGDRRQAVAFGAIAVVPLVIWRLYVGQALVSEFGSRAYFAAPAQLGLPLGGFLDMWRHIRAGDYQMALVPAATWLPIVLLAGWVLSILMVRSAPGPVTIAASVYGTLALSLNYSMVWVHTRNAERVTYELFVLLALASLQFLRASRAWRAAIVGFWALSGFYVFWIAFDADFYRNTLTSYVW